MTRWLIALAVVGSLAANAAPPSKTDRDRAELKGPVKTIAVHWTANHKDSYGEVEERDLGVTTYDEAGALVLDREYTADFIRERRPERHGAAETLFRSVMGSSVERYVFDAVGNVTEIRKWYGESATGAPSMIDRMTYDASGRETTRAFFADEKTRLDLTLYTRDERGLVVLEEDRPQDKQPPFPRMHYTYTLDAHGNWTEKTVRRENVPEDDYDYRYAGNLTRTITYY